MCILQKGKLVKRGASGVNSHVKPVLASPQINTSNSPKALYNILKSGHKPIPGGKGGWREDHLSPKKRVWVYEYQVLARRRSDFLRFSSLSNRVS